MEFRVLISVNDNPAYIQFLPLVSLNWQKLFNVKPTFIYVTDQIEENWKWMEKYGELIVCAPHSTIPPKNWTKIARILNYYKWPKETIMISDVDMMILNKGYVNDLLLRHSLSKEKLLYVTPQNYFEDKFPGVYMTAIGSIWKEIINPNDKSDDDLLSEWQKDIDLNADNFSEESLIIYLVKKWSSDLSKTTKVIREWQDGAFTNTRVDRDNWKIDERKLSRNEYIDAHCCRPLNKNLDKIKPLIDYLGIDYKEISDLFVNWWDKEFPERFQEFLGWIEGPNALSRKQVREHVIKQGYKSILDCACGPCIAKDGYDLDKYDIDYTGIDACKYTVDYNIKRGYNVKFTSIESIPFENDSFDIVYGRHIIEHIEHYRKAIEEMIRVARKEVIIVMFLPVLENTLKDRIVYTLKGNIYHNLYSAEALKNFVSSIKKVKNFEVESVLNGERVYHIKLQ